MKCFTHNNEEAVAVCKACGKALCHDCMEISANGVSCKGECQDILQEQKLESKKEAILFQQYCGIYKSRTILFVAATVILLGLGFYYMSEARESSNLLFAATAICAWRAVINRRHYLQLHSIGQDKNK